MTMENPKNSYFWWTKWVRRLMEKVATFAGDFQVCMMGGSREKWSRTLANYGDHSYEYCMRPFAHACSWGFARDESGKQVWATSLESQYPKKMCVVLTSIVLQVAESRGLRLQACDLSSQSLNPLATAASAQMGSEIQPRPSKILPIVPDFASVAVFYTDDVSRLPCTIMSKLPNSVQLFTESHQLQEVPANSRLLRITPFKEGRFKCSGAS